MSLKDITITASINSIPTQSYGQKTYIASSDEQSFPIETIDGGSGGSMPNLLGQTSSIDLYVNITQSWPGSINTPVGLVSFTHDDQSEFINGEFSGSILTATTQSLNPECWPILFPIQPDINYSMFPYITSYTDGNIVTNSDFLNTFLNPLTAPRDGEFLVHFKANTITGVHVEYNIDYIKVARVDHEGKNNTLSLQDLTNFIWVDPTVGKIDLVILSKAEYATYYLYKVISKIWIKSLISTTYFTDDNFLDYKLEATSTYNEFPIPSNEYIYLTQSWTTTADNANGFSNGQYVFPLSPNCITQITASINVYVDDTLYFPFGSSSIAFTLNGYNDTLYSHNATNAVTSLPTSLASNIYYLGPGFHTLVISSSTYQPIQTYRYELDAILLESKDIVFNSDITGSDPDNSVWPLDWAEYGATGNKVPLGTNNFLSLISSNVTIFDPPYPGGFYLQELVSPTKFIFASTGSKIPGVPIFKTGSRYQVDITIPTKTYDVPTGNYYGPPSLPVTCSWNLDNAMANINVIGYIPSGASGVVSLEFVMPKNTTPQDIGSNLVFFCPPGTSPIEGSGINCFTVLKVIVNESSSVGLNTPLFNVTQSQIPQLSTSSITLEPYLTENFTNSDCNVLMNNAELNEYDKQFMKVNYDSGQLIPTNQQQIISGTAEPAPVKAYNYRILSQILPRYNGVRVVQQKENVWTLGDISPSQTPSVTDLQTYFAYFDFVQSTSCELIDKSACHILYLIDKDGTIQTPTLSSSYYWNLIDNFETNKNANIIVEGEDGNRVYIGNKKIIRPGAIPRAVLYSQTGSGYNIQTPIVFNDNTPSDNIPNYIAKSILASTITSPIVPSGQYQSTTIPFNTLNLPAPGVSIYPPQGAIKIEQTSNLTRLRFTLYTKSHLDNFANIYWNQVPQKLHVFVSLQKSSDGTNFTTISSVPNWYMGMWNGPSLSFPTNTNSYTFPIDIVPQQGDYYRILIQNGSGYYRFILEPGTYFSVGQNPGPNAISGSYDPGNNLYYWTTGSNSKNVLTGSQFYEVYNTAPPSIQVPFSTSGYGPCLPFTIEPNIDQIRFEGDEKQVYTIIGNNAIVNQNVGFNTDFNSWWQDPANPGGSVTINPDNSITFTGNTNTIVSQSITAPLIPGEDYILTFVITDYTDGDFRILNFGGSGYPSVGINANGTFTKNVSCVSSNPIDSILELEYKHAGSNTGFTMASISYTKVGDPSTALYLILDRNIVDGTDLNSFLIRRLNPHPNFVTIDSQAISGSGYIFPEYSTDKLKQNFDNIIINLKERGLT